MSATQRLIATSLVILSLGPALALAQRYAGSDLSAVNRMITGAIRGLKA
jgi:hypothetical protein